MLLQKKKETGLKDEEDTGFSSQWKLLMFVLCFNIEIRFEGRKGNFLFKSIILFFLVGNGRVLRSL